MKGLLIYTKVDYPRNKEYIEWLTSEAKKKGLELDLKFKEDIGVSGINGIEKYKLAINRSRSYELSIMLELNGVRVYNNSQITLLGNNKLAGYRYAEERGYIYPKVYLDWESQKSVISKPNDSHGGEGIGLLEEIDILDRENRVQQELIKDLIGDIRFYIIGNKIIHAVLRTSNNKITSNFSLGGSVEYYKYTETEKEYVDGFIKGLNIDYAGVDFLITKDNRLIFNEIEDVVGSRMLSKLGINNTTELYLEHITKEQ